MAALAEAGVEDELELIGWEEIVQHDSRDDVWVVVDGVVYDMTVRRPSCHPLRPEGLPTRGKPLSGGGGLVKRCGCAA